MSNFRPFVLAKRGRTQLGRHLLSTFGHLLSTGFWTKVLEAQVVTGKKVTKTHTPFVLITTHPYRATLSTRVMGGPAGQKDERPFRIRGVVVATLAARRATTATCGDYLALREDATRGHTAAQAQTCQSGRRHVKRRGLRRYLEATAPSNGPAGTVAGLGTVSFGGPNRELLAESFRERPVSSVAEAADRIEQLTGIRRGPSQTRFFLKKLGLRWQRMAAIPVPQKKCRGTRGRATTVSC